MSTLLLAMLADHAVAHPDGKLYVTGGGIRVLHFTSFPALQPHLAIALGLEFERDELGTAHRLEIRSSGPAQEVFAKPVTASFSVDVDPLQENEPAYFHFVYTMDGLTFQIEGTYVFSIILNEKPIGAVSLRAVKVPGPIPPDLEARARLSEGYAAFASGDVSSALDIFKDVTERFPGAANGHNNLGFVLLGQGEAAPALEAFAKARNLKYFQPELLDANVGCAHYLMRDAVAASFFFEQCLRSYGYGGQAILYGINGSQLFPVQLNSAADYVALMMLNAAWSALAAEDRTTALRYLEGAQAADLDHREDASGRNFALSVEALRERLA